MDCLVFVFLFVLAVGLLKFFCFCSVFCAFVVYDLLFRPLGHSAGQARDGSWADVVCIVVAECLFLRCF